MLQLLPWTHADDCCASNVFPISVNVSSFTFLVFAESRGLTIRISIEGDVAGARRPEEAPKAFTAFRRRRRRRLLVPSVEGVVLEAFAIGIVPIAVLLICSRGLGAGAGRQKCSNRLNPLNPSSLTNLVDIDISIG